MTPLDQKIVDAVITLVRDSKGEIHGMWPTLIDHIALEAFGPLGEKEYRRFSSYIRQMGLQYVLEDSPVAMFRSTWGEISFVSRSLLDVD